METPYDGGQAMQDTLDLSIILESLLIQTFLILQHIEICTVRLCTPLYLFCLKGFQLKSLADGLIPGEVKIALRSAKAFWYIFNTATALDTPTYLFSTKGLGTKQEVKEAGENQHWT
jgi:hypothetical protein